MKVAITGGSGHLGAAVCRTMIEDGHELRALVHYDDRAFKNLPVEIIRGNVHDTTALSSLMQGVDAVVHLAGLISIGNIPFDVLQSVNVLGTRNILETAKSEGVRRMVHFSSVHAFVSPPHDRLFDETASLAGPDDFPYSRTKSAAQKLVASAEGIETIILNPTSVLGPWDFKPSLQGQMMLDFAHGRIPMLPPGGYDWVDNRDIARAAANALTMGRSGEAYLLSGRYAPVKEIASLVTALCSRKPPVRSAPLWLLRGALPFLYIWSRLRREPPLYTAESLEHLKEGHPNISAAKAEKELGFRARPLENTLEDTMNWLTLNTTNDT